MSAQKDPPDSRLRRPAWGAWEPDPKTLIRPIRVEPEDEPPPDRKQWILFGVPLLLQISGWVLALGYAVGQR